LKSSEFLGIVTFSEQLTATGIEIFTTYESKFLENGDFTNCHSDLRRSGPQLSNAYFPVAKLFLNNNIFLVRFEVLTAVTMKNGILCDVMPCGCYKNRRFGGT
jgi:hypothetical protein